MSALVLLNLLDEYGKSDKMRGLPSILSLFFATSLINLIIQEHEFKTIYLMSLKLLKILS